MKKIILDLCAGSGAWSKPYKDSGYTVIEVTLPDKDVRDIVLQELPQNIYGILAAPPCTHFSVSGAQYWKAKDEDGRTAHDLSIVDACLDIINYVNPVFWVLENPVGRLRKLREHRLGKVITIFDPCDFGDPYTKKTLLWGKFNLPKKTPVSPERVCSQGSWLQKLGAARRRQSG